MKISDELLDKFIAIHYAKHGELLSREEVYPEASRLLRLVELVESNAAKMNL